MFKIEEFGHGKDLPEGYTILKSIDFPIYDGIYFLWFHITVTIKLFWFISKKFTFKGAIKGY